MIVICRRCPAPGYEKTWAEDVLTGEGPDLNPHPSHHSQGSRGICADKKDVPGHSKEVDKGKQSQNALADDKFPAQGLRAVPHDIAVDLGHPKREVQKAHKPCIYGP